MEKSLESKSLYQGRILTLKKERVRTESGYETDREIVVHPGAVAIVPVLNENEIVLIKQYRHALGKEILEIPAGTLEAGENPADCARRELEEECGYQAKIWNSFCSFYPAPGYCTELIHLYLAEELNQTAQNTEMDEAIEPVRAEKEEILNWIKEGRIQDAKTLIGLSAWLGLFRRGE